MQNEPKSIVSYSGSLSQNWNAERKERKKEREREREREKARERENMLAFHSLITNLPGERGAQLAYDLSSGSFRLAEREQWGRV